MLGCKNQSKFQDTAFLLVEIQTLIDKSWYDRENIVCTFKLGTTLYYKDFCQIYVLKI